MSKVYYKANSCAYMWVNEAIEAQRLLSFQARGGRWMVTSIAGPKVGKIYLLQGVILMVLT